MADQKTFPKLRGAVLRLALLIGGIVVLYYGKSLLLPLAVAALLAMLISPVDDKLRAWGWPRGLAIAGAMTVVLLFFAGLFFAIGKQTTNFVEDWPKTEERLKEQLQKARTNYGLESIIPEVAEEGASGQSSIVQQLPVERSGMMSFLSQALGSLGDFLLMLVYVVMLLAQKERLREFLVRRMPDDKREETLAAINESTDIVQDYLRGRLILIVILTVLYSIGFLIVGIDYAVLIAVLVAVMSIIPYLGNIIGGLFAVALAFAGGGGSTAVLGILGTMAVAQTLESYVLTPLIVGDEVDINPLTTIICVIGMNLLWGPVGAILAIPFFAIIRIICSHVPGLGDYAYLLGQE